jgi:hypothetical protein
MPGGGEMTEDEIIMDKMQRFVQDLQEHHLVNVRIFVTGNRAGQCRGESYGNGDIYSILGYVREWLIQQDERAKGVIRQEEREADPA